MKKLTVLFFLMLFSVSLIHAQKADKLFSKAKAKLEVDDYVTAEKFLGKALQADENHTASLNAMGDIKSKQLKHKEAVTYYERSLKADPNQAEISYKKGRSNVKIKLYEAAIVDFTNTIKLNDKHHLAYKDRGEAYSILKKLKLACEDWKKAASLGNKNAAALLTIKCNRK